MAIIENYTTTVAAAKTAAAMQKLLVDHGATAIMNEYANGKLVGITFATPTEFGSQTFRLPVDVDAMHRVLVQEKRAGRLPSISEARAADVDHAERVAWRVVAEWLRAQMTLIRAAMATVDQVMLPYLVVDGRSVYDAYREQHTRELTTGDN